MTHRVGPEGEIVLPRALRDAIGIGPGDEVDFAYVDGGIVVQPALGRPLRGRFSGSPLAEDLITERTAERRTAGS